MALALGPSGAGGTWVKLTIDGVFIVEGTFPNDQIGNVIKAGLDQFFCPIPQPQTFRSGGALPWVT